MALGEAFLEELKTRVSLADIVGRRVRLLRAGRDLKGCCPFHGEKTPSFHVYADHYHCFGCGAHGDAIRFLMEADGLDFMGAVRALAAEAGMEVPETRASPAQARASGLHRVLEAAAGWFAERLAAAEGADARAYLARRGVDEGLARAFGLGWAPASGLEAALKARLPDADRALLAEAGLLTEEGRQRFRARLMFPIRDGRGRTVGFGGRLLGVGEPKYLNSADGPVFHKGRLLFNLDRAAAPARKAGRLVLVEGYMDVIGLARVGLAETVAPLGTALTEAQLALAWRVVPEPVLAFDGDAAGLRAAARAAQLALAGIGPGRSLRIALLAAGEDPDDLARRGGREAVEALLAGARPLERFLFDVEAAVAPLDTPERRADLRRRLDALAATIPDAGLARDYRESWRARADALFAPRGEGRRQRRGSPPPGSRLPPARAETRAARSTTETMQATLLAALAARPRAIERHREALAELRFASPALDAARDALLSGTTPDLPPGLDPKGLAALDDAAFDARVAAALASYLVRAHMPVLRRGALPGDPVGAGAGGSGARVGAALAEARARLIAPVLEVAGPGRLREPGAGGQMQGGGSVGAGDAGRRERD